MTGKHPRPGTSMNRRESMKEAMRDGEGKPCLHHRSFCVCVSHLVVSDPLPLHGLQPTRLLCPWNSLGKTTGVDCHFLLQGIFPTQGLKPRSPALQADSLPTESPGKPLFGRQELCLMPTILKFRTVSHTEYVLNYNVLKKECMNIQIV